MSDKIELNWYKASISIKAELWKKLYNKVYNLRLKSGLRASQFIRVLKYLNDDVSLYDVKYLYNNIHDFPFADDGIEFYMSILFYHKFRLWTLHSKNIIPVVPISEIPFEERCQDFITEFFLLEKEKSRNIKAFLFLEDKINTIGIIWNNNQKNDEIAKYVAELATKDLGVNINVENMVETW